MQAQRYKKQGATTGSFAPDVGFPTESGKSGFATDPTCYCCGWGGGLDGVAFETTPVTTGSKFRGLFTCLLNLCLHLTAMILCAVIGIDAVSKFHDGENMDSTPKHLKRIYYMLALVPILSVALTLFWYGLFKKALAWPVPYTFLGGSFILTLLNLGILVTKLVDGTMPTGAKAVHDDWIFVAFIVQAFVVASYIGTPLGGLYAAMEKESYE